VGEQLAAAGSDVNHDLRRVVVRSTPQAKEGVGEDRSGDPVRRRREVRRRPTAGDIETQLSGIQRGVPGVTPRDGIHEEGL